MPVIKLFGAEWCGTCKMIRPLLDRVGTVEYVDVDEDVAQTAEFGVRNLPTYINMDNNERGSGPVKNLAELKEVLGIS